MESVLSSSDMQGMVSSFLEIAVGQTADTARQFLQATSWKLEEALQLFYVGNEAGAIAAAAALPELPNNPASWADQESGGVRDLGCASVGEGQFDGDEVRPPLPVIREALYDDALAYGASRIGYPPHESSSVVAFRNFSKEIKQPATWESGEGSTSTAENSRDNLASLYRPPFHLMFHGSFEKAKGAAAAQDKWLLVNLQSSREFSSHMLNRDTWAHEAVSQTITTNFIFWQVYEDTSEGKKVCTYYRLDSVPVVLVIDPITGQKMRSWCGMIQPESLLEDLLQFMDNGPKQHHVSLSHKRPRESSLTPPPKTKVAVEESNEEDSELLAAAIAASMGGMKHTSEETPDEEAKEEKASSVEKPTYPPLPEEPKGDRNLLCRVGVRLPDGRRVQRNFLRIDPLQLLWSFCSFLLGEAETRPFRLTHAIPGASKCLDYQSKLSFGESGLANSMISVTWE